MRWRVLNREGCSLLEEVSGIPPLLGLSYISEAAHSTMDGLANHVGQTYKG
jgi:hypothetical protein